MRIMDMENQWTVHVKKFGKIEEAEIQAAPLTLFIGDNNSGKSYIMTLLYGLWSLDFWGEYDLCEESPAYRKCFRISERIVNECKNDVDMEYILQGEELKVFQQLLNLVLARNKKRFLKKLFNKEIEIQELYIEFPVNAQYRFHFSYNKDISGGMNYRSRANEHNWIFKGEGAEKVKLAQVQVACILSGLLQWNVVGPVYFPTARTGFLLTYKELTRSALHNRYSIDETNKTLLTKPATDFLMVLSTMNIGRSMQQYSKIIGFIERHIISGHIQTSSLPVHDIWYEPEGSEESIPLHVASGVVTEVTPLLLFLQHSLNMGALLIEEPEISLHPQLQWEMTRVLIRLMNQELPVLASTHSDIVLQHINNMIKANEMSKKDRFLEKTGYEPEDLLSRERVAVYQFDEQKNGQTRLTKLPCGDYGFEAVTFYNTLKNMNKQIDFIEDGRE